MLNRIILPNLKFISLLQSETINWKFALFGNPQMTRLDSKRLMLSVEEERKPQFLINIDYVVGESITCSHKELQILSLESIAVQYSST